VEAFYGPEAETLEDDLALARRIRVTRDLTAFCGLSEPTLRGERFNWNKNDDSEDELKGEEDSLLGPELAKMSDQCTYYLSRLLQPLRPSSTQVPSNRFLTVSSDKLASL
jgi:hypothetical protein